MKTNWQTKTEFRKKVLQLHYDISDGDILNLVMRPAVAEKLNLKDFNNNELLSTIKYLEDKEYLKVITNVQDQITVAGIDEVESNFPNFSMIKEDREEILKLSPEFYGIGINLKIFWKKIKSCFEK
ncbi:MAG: hypothetical protein WAV73_01435 [Candidatus Moraniibacteriota bacterium]